MKTPARIVFENMYKVYKKKQQENGLEPNKFKVWLKEMKRG